MSDFTVKTGAMRSCASEFSSLSGSASRISDMIEDACRMKGADSESMRAALQSAFHCGQSARELSDSIRRLGSVLDECASLYERCEEGIVSSGGTVSEVPLRHPKGQAKIPSRSRTVTAAAPKSGAGESGPGTTGGSSSPEPTGSTSPGPHTGEWSFDAGRPLYTWQKPGSQDGGADQSGNIHSVLPSGAKLYEWNAGTQAAASYAEGRIPFSWGSVSGSVGSAQAYAQAGASLSMTASDGKPVFAPYVSAEAGASVSLLEGTVSANYGNDTASISGTGSAVLGKAELSGAVAASLLDESGRVSPRLSGHASAQAVAAEASGSVSGSLAGATATLSGGLNVGVGAHADFGISPTSISCDVGASLGVGGSFGFSVDFSGMVDALRSTAESVWNYLFPGSSSGA